MSIYLHIYLFNRNIILIFDRIIEVRKSLNFHKQEDFANELGMSLRTYQTYEQGKVSTIPHTFIEKLHTMYNISIQWLLFGNGNMFIDKQDIVYKDNLNIEEETIAAYKQLSAKRKEYYYHRIKADLIKEEF